jgi:hypothetical protein
MALGQVFLPVRRFFSPVTIISLMLRTYLQLHVALSEGQTGEACENSTTKIFRFGIVELWIEKYL